MKRSTLFLFDIFFFQNSARAVVVPGDWLTALKTVEWPNSREAQLKFDEAIAAAAHRA